MVRQEEGEGEEGSGGMGHCAVVLQHVEVEGDSRLSYTCRDARLSCVTSETSEHSYNIMCLCMYSELPLIWTPEMRPPLYSGHFKMFQSMLPSANLPLK